MGVSLQQYRISIGLYTGSKLFGLSCEGSFQYCHGACHIGFLLMLIPSILLSLLLLLISGIEPNPGPIFTCSVCNTSFNQPKSYFDHQILHLSVKNVKNLKIKCPYTNCNSKLSTFQSWSTHLSRCEGSSASSSEVLNLQKPSGSSLWPCAIDDCHEQLDSRKVFILHMSEHLDKGDSFACPFGACKANHSKTSSFVPHMSRYHKQERLSTSEESCEKSGDEPVDVDLSYVVPEDMCISDTLSEDNDGPDDNLYPDNAVKDEVARFYLRLEGSLLLASTTVQIISEEIALLCKLSHHCLKKALSKEMSDANIDQAVVDSVINKVFKSDVVFNIHHKNEDIDQMSSTYMRKKYIKENFPYIEPREIQLGKHPSGKPKVAQYVTIRDTLTALLKDPKVKELVLNSFDLPNMQEDILQDFTDGSAFKTHKTQHPDGNCLQLLLFQDGFEFNPFGPAKGLYKSVGMYYNLGNLPPEHRSKVDLIQLVYLIQEQDLKCSDEEHILERNKWEEILQPLTNELEDLKTNGIKIDDKIYPVCLLFTVGDNLGSHQIGSFVQSFSAMFSCRFCSLSTQEFRLNPSACPPLRTPSEYDECVAGARRKWLDVKKKALISEAKKKKKKVSSQASKIVSRSRAPETENLVKKALSKAACRSLRSINFRGVKSQPSPLNKIPGFHVASPALPPCLAHDLFEGIINVVLAKILKYCIDVKNWFDLKTLNARIQSFPYKYTDAADAPSALKSFDGIKGHACENWTLLRLLPFIIGDLIQDPNDIMWQLYLQLKEICEYVCAPRIRVSQVLYLKTIIKEYLCSIKELLPDCLIPKQHFLSHYPELIMIFGPLIRLFTLRFESKHVFFKAVARVCKNFINITYTLAQKYQYRFAYDHSSEILRPDVSYEDSASSIIVLEHLPADVQRILSCIPEVKNCVALKKVTIKGVLYQENLWFVLGKTADSPGLAVGRIEKILCNSSDEIKFVLREFKATNTYLGYYSVCADDQQVCHVKGIHELLDYYPLVSYSVNGLDCISLKHSIICL